MSSKFTGKMFEGAHLLTLNKIFKKKKVLNKTFNISSNLNIFTFAKQTLD